MGFNLSSGPVSKVLHRAADGESDIFEEVVLNRTSSRVKQVGLGLE